MFCSRPQVDVQETAVLGGCCLGLEPIPVDLGRLAGYTLDKSSVHLLFMMDCMLFCLEKGILV